ncbi:GntR family transcriptional regulator [Solicola sp. PLA-1-18]|uniref:GntR family transcriptional regulator n=1 Tax=Solicola sp. PLA-1-18 TaxID=3380532 RepID=UPI003B799F90
MDRVDDDGGAKPSGVASHRIAEHLRELILSGQMAPGQRVRQEELAAQFATSRIPVREALRILEAAGLVRLRTSSGAWVSEMDERECQLAYEMRERLEPLLLAQGFARLTSHDVDELEAVQEQIERHRDVEQFLVLDRRLHWITYRHHDADDLAAVVSRLWDTTQHYRRAFTQLAGDQRRWIISAEHQLLIQAVRDRDLAAAQDVLRLHIRRTRIELAAHPEVFA